MTLAMLRLARVGARDFVIDLGSGDGRIVIVAAKRFGARGLGVEIVPELVRRSRENAKRARVEGRVEFREQDLFATDLAPATVVTLYLLPDVNLQLRPALLALKPGTRVVSHDWDMGEWKPDRTITVPAPEKRTGIDKSSRVHLWIVPARLEGSWCATGKARGTTLQLMQSFQQMRGALALGGATHAFEARLDGPKARTAADAPQALGLELERGQLRVTHASGDFEPLKGVAFSRRTEAACS